MLWSELHFTSRQTLKGFMLRWQTKQCIQTHPRTSRAPRPEPGSSPVMTNAFLLVEHDMFLYPSRSMGSGLSSMSHSCLGQQRDAYPYMFHHDPLSSLSSYGRTCANSQAVANSHMAYGSGLGSGAGSHGKQYIISYPSELAAMSKCLAVSYTGSSFALE